MIITLADLDRIGACDLDRRRADLSAHLGRPATNADGLTMAEWAALRRADGEGLSATTPDLSWAMFRLDRLRWMRAFACVLEAILPSLPSDADPRSLAVIPALRSGAVSEHVRAAAEAAARAAAEAAEAEAEAAARAARAAEAAARAARAAAEAARAAAEAEAAARAARAAEAARAAARAAAEAAARAARAAAEAEAAARAARAAWAAAEAAEARGVDVRAILLAGWGE